VLIINGSYSTASRLRSLIYTMPQVEPECKQTEDPADPADPANVIATVVKNAPETVRRIVQADPLVPIALRGMVHLMRKTDEDWLQSRGGRWVHMIKAIRLRNETEHRLKEPISNVQTVSDMCQTLEYALRTESTFSFLKGADRLPKFCLMLDSGDEQWFLHSSHNMLLGLLLNLDCEHSQSAAFEKAYVTLLEEFEALHCATAADEQISLVLFYAQARGSPCCRRYFELRVVGRKALTSNASNDLFDVDTGNRLLTSSCTADLRRYVGRARQSVEIQRLKRCHVPHTEGHNQSMEAIVNNQLKCMLQKMKSHFIYVDVDEDPVDRMVRPESSPTSMTDSVTDSTTDSCVEFLTDSDTPVDAKKSARFVAKKESTCRRCQTTLDVMHCKTQLYQRTLDEARASLNETVERETAKTRQIEQKLQAMELLNQNMTECHHEELAKMRETINKYTTEITHFKQCIVEMDAQLKQTELILDEATSSTTKKKRRGGKKRADDVDALVEAEEVSINALQVQVQKLEGQLSSVEDECKELQTENNEAEAKLQSHAEDFERRETELQEHCRVLKRAADDKDVVLESTRGEVRKLKLSADKATQQVHSLKESHQKAINTLTSEHDALVRRMQEINENPSKQPSRQPTEQQNILSAETSALAADFSNSTTTSYSQIDNTVEYMKTTPMTQIVEKPPPSPPLKEKHSPSTTPAPPRHKNDKATGRSNFNNTVSASGGCHTAARGGGTMPSTITQSSYDRYMKTKMHPSCAHNAHNRTYSMQMRPPPMQPTAPQQPLQQPLHQPLHQPFQQPPLLSPQLHQPPSAMGMAFYGMQQQPPAYNYNYMPMMPLEPHGPHGPHGYSGFNAQGQPPGFQPYVEYGAMYEGAPGMHATQQQDGFGGGFGASYAGSWTSESKDYYTDIQHSKAVLDDNHLVKTMTGGQEEATHTAKEMLSRLKALAKTHHLSAEEIHSILHD